MIQCAPNMEIAAHMNNHTVRTVNRDSNAVQNSASCLASHNSKHERLECFFHAAKHDACTKARHPHGVWI